MAATHGKNGYFTWVSGGAARDMSTYLKTTGADLSQDMVDVSTFGDDAKKYIPGLEDGTISLEGVWDATVDGWISANKGAGEKAFVYCPAGNNGGYPKYTGSAILTSYNISQDLGGEIKFNATLQISGDATRGTV